MGEDVRFGQGICRTGHAVTSAGRDKKIEEE
jgi:hypothetical protein